jgi:cellulose biosynthesis protein BcsQ
MKQIAMFNHKGGVAKTTTTFHLGWMLAELGYRVMLVDCDPQCNLTGTFLGEFEGDDYPYESKDPKKPLNIKEAVAPAFDSRPYPISPVELQVVPACANLFFLPGHVSLAEYESQLAVAHELSNSLSALQNIPGALHHAIQVTGEANKIDIAIIDMSPSLGALNQNLFMTSDAFIIPMAPDLFSAMALSSLSRVLVRWSDWSKKAASNSILRVADYPFPETHPKYLGATVQNYRKRSRGGEEAKPTKAFQRWFDRLNFVKDTQLLTALQATGMLLEAGIYAKAGAPVNSFLMEVASFDSLIAEAQEAKKPVFDLKTSTDIKSTGVVAEQQQAKIDDVRKQFFGGSQKVANLIKEF